MSAILKIRDSDGTVREILAIKGADGKDYVITDADYQAIATIVSGMVSIPDTTGFLTEEQVLALIQANMPTNGDEVSY